MLDQNSAQYNFGVEFLIAGVDTTGGHIFSVSNPGGTYNEYCQIGYAAIGSGAIHAVQSMIGFGHTGKCDLLKTIFYVYASKRRAEVAPGVGKDTDLAIINHEGVTQLTGDQLASLEELYNEYIRPLDQGILDKLEKLDLVRPLEVV
jgi:20S proteasome alpha/beta subunit